ncbi:YchJ family protein [Actinomyces minihominis]|uniref:YchJ family protein n=1 Tax=Actinomyces minihominis TaxID=2002838 RepID=UPI001F5C49BD|nr:YchJ family metal-binding protein [Actinomyces minihominis]
MSPKTWPNTAEELMRSRFSAFKEGDRDWLLASWHPSTRPANLDLSGNPVWRGLQILDTRAGGTDDTEGIVEFRATYLTNDGIQVMHERSNFVREDGRWYYVDGAVDEPSSDQEEGVSPLKR